MIKARTDNTFIFGLSENNVKKLKEGMPILFNLKEQGLGDIDMNVLICYGETEHHIVKELNEHGLVDPMKTNFQSPDAQKN